ncbi:MAG: hypothetical protein KatS3mg009_2000 [Acidimicrobiia bacterium]|nr:MAG: hypothetical protein KatS3mg009_2000 [Acidimicrobiia bacterium]
MSRRGGERGFVTAEWVAAVAFLLLPVLVVVGTVPAWAARRHTATVAAQEAARAVRAGRVADDAGVLFVARAVAAQRGVRAADVTAELDTAPGRGGTVSVRVHVRMPALAVPGAGAGVGSWGYTAEHHLRLDDLRSR